jgi:SAM-dependent methyltransferase
MNGGVSYLMENPFEVERLEAKTHDVESRQQLEMVGLGPGMKVLDAGAGTGAVARVIARRTGRRGLVVALDPSQPRLASGSELARPSDPGNLRFVAGDLYDAPLRPESFDFVWCRHVFQYLREPARALARLISLTRPGGKVVVGELDGYGLNHHPCSDELRQGLIKLERTLQGAFDPYAGRKLYTLFHAAGLEEIRVHLLPHHLYAGRPPESELRNWEIKFQTIRPLGILAFGGESPYDSFARNFLDFLAAPSTFTYSVLLLVEGVRP